MLFEEHTTWLLVVHTFFGFATLGLTTHLVFWLRPYLRGQFGRQRSVRRFSLWATAAFATTMLVGLALYPTYKVRGRGEYLENPSAITRETEEQARAATLAYKRHQESLAHRAGEAGTVIDAHEIDAEEVAIRAEERIGRGARIARWFDIKEHWSALGFMLSIAVLGILLIATPSKERPIEKAVFAMAIGAAASAWASAIIGVITAASRSIGHM